MEEERACASAPFSSLSVEKAESCAFCRTKLSFSSEPKLLPCLHMMCKACAVNTTVDNNAKECPVCGQSFHLSEVTDCFIFKDSAPKCGGCEESALTGWCQECEEALCSDCVSAHQRVKVTRNHTVIPQAPQSGLSTSLRCTSHKQEQLKFFCVTCDQLTCRDCQLIDHRNHSFLLLEEAVVSHKEQLMKLLDSISEQKNSVRSRLQDLDGRLNDIKELKASSEKQLQRVLRSLYVSLMLRCQQLSKELVGLCDEEEKSLKVIKMSLKKLEDRQEYITTFLHKILSTEGQCALRHKMQIEKCAQRLLSQNKHLPDTVIQISLTLNEHVCNIIKKFGSLKVTRVPLPAKGKHSNGNKPNNTPKDTDKRSSGLNSESGATLSISDTTSTQATASSVSRAASDLPQCGQSESASSKPVQPTQGLIDTMSHSSSSSVSHTFAPPQNIKSNMTQYVVSQTGQHLPQSVPPQASQLRHVFRSLSQQTVSKIIPSNCPQHNIVMPKVLLPQSHSGAVLAALPGLTSHPSVLVQTSSTQSSHSSSIINTQSYSLSSNQFVPSLITLAPFAQSSQAMSNPQPSTLNSSSNHTQQSIPNSQTVSGQPFPSQTAPTNNFLHNYPAISDTQSVNVQPSPSGGTQSNRLQLTLFKVPNNTASPNSRKAWKFYHYTPVLTINKGTTLTCAPKPAPGITTVPGSSNKDVEPPAPSTPPLPAAPIPSTGSNTGLIECGTQTIQIPKCELPVKALADSVCEGDMSVYSRASPISEESDSNLPTSTVPEKDTRAREVSAVHQPRDPLSTSSIKDCPTEQSLLTKLPVKSISTLASAGSPSTKHWLTGLPSTFREILSSKIKVHPEDDCSRSVLEHASVHNVKDEENTDDSDSELVEGMDDLKDEPILRQDSNKTLLVSLLRLPISGSSLSRFRITHGSQKDEILLQEIEENQSIQRCLRIAAPPAAASPSQSGRFECSLQVDVLDCAVCLSAGASLQCAECGRSFHTSCHVPPIIFNPTAVWVCSLCQDLLNDTDPFRCNRLEEPYLSLPDQRVKFETLHTYLNTNTQNHQLSEINDLCLSHKIKSIHKFNFCSSLPFHFPSAVNNFCSLLCVKNIATCSTNVLRYELRFTYLSSQLSHDLYIIYILSCKLFCLPIKQPASCVEFSLIIGRLLGKCRPPYRSAAEMVSDLWVLFHNLSSNSRKKDLVFKLQSSFQQRLNASFGTSLHASLLRPLNSEDHTGAPETEPDRQKAKNTLKRMRAFLAANCTLVAKKARSEDT